MIGEAASLELLGRAWDEVERSAAEYLREARAAVVQWTWCGPDAHVWERREPVAGDEKPMRLVDDDPGAEQRHRFARFGYGSDGAIVYAQRFTNHWEGRSGGWQHGVVWAENVWRDGVLLSFEHLRHGTEHHRVLLSTLSRHVVDDSGRTVERHSWGRDTSSRTLYQWEGDVLSSAVSESFDGALGDDTGLVWRLRLTYERDELGLVRVRWTTEFHRHLPDAVGDSGVAWVRRSPAALRAARRLVDRELPARIVAWAERVAPAEPVYGLGLMWSIDAPGLPPSLGLGTVRELRDWRQRGAPGFELRSWIWNPAEFACFDPLPAELVGDAALDDAYALLRQDWELAENEREPATTLRRCAKHLLEVDWSAALTAAGCFCVFVVADELDDTLSRQLRKTVAAQQQRLIERGAV
jgi:hypothetical protein